MKKKNRQGKDEECIMKNRKEKMLYNAPEITTVTCLDMVDIITTSGGGNGGGSSGGGTVVPPITNGGDFNGEDY